MTENENERFQEMTRRIAETGLFSLSENKDSLRRSKNCYSLKNHEDVELVLLPRGAMLWFIRKERCLSTESLLSSLDFEIRTELLFHLDLLLEVSEYPKGRDIKWAS